MGNRDIWSSHYDKREARKTEGEKLCCLIRTNTANRLRELPHCVKSVSGQKPQTFLSNYPTVEEDCNNYRKEKCFPPRAFEEEFKADFFSSLV